MRSAIINFNVKLYKSSKRNNNKAQKKSYMYIKRNKYKLRVKASFRDHQIYRECNISRWTASGRASTTDALNGGLQKGEREFAPHPGQGCAIWLIPLVSKQVMASLRLRSIVSAKLCISFHV